MSNIDKLRKLILKFAYEVDILMRTKAIKRSLATLSFLTIISTSCNLFAASVTDYGAVCDGTTDDISAFNAAWQDLLVGNIGTLEIEGNCHLSSPWFLNSNTTAYHPKLISGWGAVLDNTVVVNASGVSIKGLTVENAPKDGFAFLRGQGASHERLHASNNGRHGFYFGIDSGNYGNNSQVTNVVFTLLSSIDNAGDGFHWNGFAIANRSWLNANTFIQPVARGNGGRGWNHVAGLGPTGLVSRVNYNTLIGLQFERNGDIPDFSFSRAFTYLGSHIADKNSLGESMVPGDISYILGGRVAGDIRNKNFDNTILLNSSASGEGARLHYLRHLDSVDTN